MSEAYTVPYTLTDDVTFPTKKGMQKHLEHELDAWRDFLTAFEAENYFKTLQLSYNTTVDQPQIAQSLQRLHDLLETPQVFQNAASKKSHRQQAAFPPPPSSSFIGRLILGLFENNATYESSNDSMCVFLWFIFGGQISGVNVPAEVTKLMQQGKQLFGSAKVVQAMPLHDVSHQKLSAAVRNAEAQVVSLKEEIKSAQVLNAEHDKNLSEKLEEFSEDYQATEDDILSQQDALLAAHRTQIVALDEKLKALTNDYTKKLLDFKKRVDASEKERQSAELQRVQNHEEHIALLEKKLQFDKPITLWGALSESHGRKAIWALISFIVLTGVAIWAGFFVPFRFGDQIAASFFVEVCLPSGAEDCVTSREFSARGPLTISGILAATTLVFWLIRLQFKVFLSERHLSLDAAEKKAFAQTYLAMKEGKDISKESEAIVLAALFRPTQDGIIKDDEASLDISAAAILAKQLSK